MAWKGSPFLQHKHTNIHAHPHRHTQAYSLMQYSHTHSFTHVPIYVRAHTHTHTHTHNLYGEVQVPSFTDQITEQKQTLGNIPQVSFPTSSGSLLGFGKKNPNLSFTVKRTKVCIILRTCNSQNPGYLRWIS